MQERTQSTEAMIEFNEEKHEYTNSQGQKYLSATQLISEFKQPFDAKNIAKRYAEKHGETPEYWIAKWAEKRDTACERGTLFHQEQEEYVLGRGVDMNSGKVFTVQNQALIMQFTPDLYQLPDGLYPELRMWHNGYRIAGTADKTFIETIKDKRYVDLDDYKTNERINMTSFKSYATGHKMMKGPLKHLMDCNFQHYELQLSIYAFMLEAAGFIPRNLQFTHYPHPNTENPFEDREPQIYPVQYRKAEVLAMIKAYRNKNR